MPSPMPLPTALVDASARAVIRAGVPELLVNRPAEIALDQLRAGRDFATSAPGGDRYSAHAKWRTLLGGTSTAARAGSTFADGVPPPITAADSGAVAGYRELRDARERALGLGPGPTVHGTVQFRAPGAPPSTGALRYGEVGFVARQDALDGARLVPNDSFYVEGPTRGVDQLAQVVAGRVLRSHDLVRDRGETSSPWSGSELEARRSGLLEALHVGNAAALEQRVLDVVGDPESIERHYIEAIMPGLALRDVAEVRIDLSAMRARLGDVGAERLAAQLRDAAAGRQLPATIHDDERHQA